MLNGMLYTEYHEAIATPCDKIRYIFISPEPSSDSLNKLLSTLLKVTPIFIKHMHEPCYVKAWQSGVIVLINYSLQS